MVRQILVEKVEKGLVTERVGDVYLDFSLVNGKVRNTSVYKEVRIYDPKVLRLPKKVFIAALKQAAAILRKQQ